MARKNDDDDKTTPFIRDEGDPIGTLPKEPFRGHAPAVVGTIPRQAIGTHYMEAKNVKWPAWAIPLIAFVVVFHVGFLGFSWASSIWAIDRLDRPAGAAFDIAIAPPPPPPPPPPPGGAKPQTQTIEPKKRTVKDLVQQVKMEKPQQKQEESGDPAGEVGGEVGGQAGGVVGGDLNGVVGAPPPPPPPPPPPQTTIVPPNLLETQRIAGEKQIVPDDVTKTEIQRSGKDKIVGAFKLCITIDGNVSTISQMGKGTGFPAYDGKIQREMRNWKYRPFLVNGKPAPVCTAVTFIYSQH
jgi:protein TonB